MSQPSPFSPECAGLYFLAGEHALRAEAEARTAGLRVTHVDLATCTNTAQALAAIGSQLAFPDWYGANFDALYDCLTDPDWQAVTDQWIRIAGLATLRQQDPDGCATLIEVLQATCADRRSSDHPLWFLIDLPLHGIGALA